MYELVHPPVEAACLDEVEHLMFRKLLGRVLE
jgi:hypothetical protein